MVFAISKSKMYACYGSELLKSAELTCIGLHIELEIPFYNTYAKYQSDRTVAIPRPLSSGKNPSISRKNTLSCPHGRSSLRNWIDLN